MTPPGQHWEKFGIRVLGKAGTYERALRKQKQAEYSSDINTDVNESRAPKKRKIYKKRFDSSSEEDEENSLSFNEVPVPLIPPPMTSSPRPRSSPEEVPFAELGASSFSFEKNSSTRVLTSGSPHQKRVLDSSRTPSKHSRCRTINNQVGKGGCRDPKKSVRFNIAG